MKIKIFPHSIAMTLAAGVAACALMSSAHAFNPQPDPPGKPAIGESKMHNPPADKADKSRKAKGAKSGVVGPNDKGALIDPNDKGAVIGPNDKKKAPGMQ